jgi:hypothetical protein
MEDYLITGYKTGGRLFEAFEQQSPPPQQTMAPT